MKKNAKRDRRPRQPRQKAPRAPFGIYANHVIVQWGCSEMNVIFGQTHPEGTNWPITEVSRVTMPMEAAKVLAFVLMSNIAAFEAILGPVNLARQLVPDMPASGVLSPDTVARLSILHADLFAHVPTPEPVRPIEHNDLGPHVTKH